MWGGTQRPQVQGLGAFPDRPKGLAGMSHFYAPLHSPEAFFQKEARLVTCRFICKQEGENVSAPQISLPSPSKAAYGEPITA